MDPLQHIEELGFVPHILASDFIYLNANNILSLQNKNIKVFAFTVNQIADIENQLAMGVDAIITDYPDVAARCLNYYKYPEK
jgi:glycerophosphoryl diester phosphodiesterase